MLLKVLFVILSVVMPAVGEAYAQSVANVDAKQEGKAIAITYDLKEQSDITIFVTDNNGVTKTEIPLGFTSGDVGRRMSPGVGKKILWRVLDQYPNQDFKGENLSFIVKAKPCTRFITMLDAGYSLDSGFITGITVGQLGVIGWYAKAMTTLATAKAAEYECDANGAVKGVYPAYSGLSSKSRAYGLAGVTVRVGAPVYIQLGAGYGSRNYDWETIDGKWVKNIPGSYSGIAVNAGIIGKLGSIVLSAGATLLGGSLDIDAGVGYVF